jgi:glutamate racemase
VGRLTVGLFDSGIGGLSVLRRMLDLARPPWSEIVYLADLAHFPYGPRSSAEVRDLALAGVACLRSHGAAAVAVACNTAASSGVRAGLASAAAPLYDIIGPGAREVATLAASIPASRILILGTEGTIGSRVWEKAIRAQGYSGTVLGWACPSLAGLIESGPGEPVIHRAVLDALRGLGSVASATAAPAATDIAVLGCTHYAFAAAAFERILSTDVLGRPVRVVDPAGALAGQLAHEIGKCGGEQEGLNADAAERRVKVRFLTTGQARHLEDRVEQLMGDRLAAVSSGRPRVVRVREVCLGGEVSQAYGGVGLED